MNLSTLCILLVPFLNGTHAKSDQDAKKYENKKTVNQKQHKREPNSPKYEMREVILYLTPSQIRALEGQGLTPRYQFQPVITRYSEKLHNQQSIPNIENQQQINQEEYQHNLPNNAQITEKNQRLPLEQHIIQNDATKQLNQHAHLHQDSQHQIPQYPKNHQNINTTHNITHLPQHQHIHHVPEQQILSHQTQPQYPRSYSYLYFYPKGNQKIENLNLAQPQLVTQYKPSKFYISQPHENLNWPTSQYKLVPHEYNSQRLAEAIDIYNQPITKSVVAQRLDSDNFYGQIMEFHRLPAHEIDIQQHLAQYVMEQLPKASLQGNFNFGESTQQKKGKFENEQLIKSQQEAHQGLSENPVDIRQQQALQLKAHSEHQEILEAQKVESLKLDTHLESQELQAEIDKAEELKAKHESQNHEVESTHVVEHYAGLQQSPSKLFNANIDGHMDTLLSPLLQHQSVEQTLKHKYLTQNEPKLESRIQSLVYLPKDETEKYSKDVSKVLEAFHKEKQEAWAKAAGISQEPAVLVHQEEKILRTVAPEVKQVTAPTSYYVPVPQPYPVPLEIINHVPVPIVKVQKVEVEKAVPFEVEKRVPVPTIKKVAVNVDKPYIVEKHVPVEVTQKVPVKVTVKVP